MCRQQHSFISDTDLDDGATSTTQSPSHLAHIAAVVGASVLDYLEFNRQTIEAALAEWHLPSNRPIEMEGCVPLSKRAYVFAL